MPPMRDLQSVIAIFSCLLATSQSAAASCVNSSVQESLQRASVVFSGTVIEIDEQLFETVGGAVRDRFNTFEIHRSWKGIEGNRVTILTSSDDGLADDPFRFELGEEYLVFGYLGFHPSFGGEERILQTNACTRTKLLSTAAEDLEALGALSETLVKLSLWGQIKKLTDRLRAGPGVH